MTALLLFAAAAALAWALTGAVRRYALARAVLDVPNHRSLHERPVPRGGGLAIAAVILGGTAALGAAGWIAPSLALAVGVGGAAIAAVGWADDHAHVPARWRALVHFAAAAWAVWWLGGFPALRVGAGSLPLGFAGTVLAAVGVVWLTNLYNFMDGIDGIAGGEALVAGAVGGALLWMDGERGLGALALLTAASALGFLAWNWAPARIFMGDVGSGLLGFVFAVLALASERAGSLPLLAWMLLLGVFVFDATATLVRRVLRGERFYDAHRSHAYQRAVQAVGSHARVSGAVVALGAVLGALAAVAAHRSGLLLPAVAAGLVLLSLLYAAVERLRPMYSGDAR